MCKDRKFRARCYSSRNDGALFKNELKVNELYTSKYISFMCSLTILYAIDNYFIIQCSVIRPTYKTAWNPQHINII